MIIHEVGWTGGRWHDLDHSLNCKKRFKLLEFNKSYDDDGYVKFIYNILSFTCVQETI